MKASQSLLGLTLAVGFLLLPSGASAQSAFGLTPQYQLEPPTEQQSAEADPEELSLEARRAIQARLKLRRKMVNFHQVFAITAAASLVAADVIGMANSTALSLGTPKRTYMEPPLALHRILAATALTSYMAAGITAWTMPPALRLNQNQKNKKKLDSGDLHVAFSIVHGIAMATVITTGLLQANVVPAGKGWDALVTTHSVAGITAAGFVIAAGITIGTL